MMAAEQRQGSADRPEGLRRPEILLIDRADDLRRIVYRHFDPRCAIGHATTGAAGVAMLGHARKHLVILEYRLPDACGLEILERIKADQPRLPVVMVTAEGSESVCAAAFRQGVSDYYCKPIADSTEFIRSIETLLLRRWHQARPAVSSLAASEETRRQRIFQAARIVEHHFAEDMSLDEIARMVDMDRFAFSREFKRVMTVSFRSYRQVYRVSQACDFLRSSSRSISEIAQTVGFADLPRFDKVFKEQMGFSPSEFRRRRDGAKNDKK